MMKSELREHILTQRGAIEPAARLLWDQLIFERAHKHRAFQLARRVHVYRSVRDEVETLPLIEYAWGIGKDVFVPVVPPGSATMRHCKVTWRTEWREGAFGILEPANAVAEDYVDEPSFFDESSARSVVQSSRIWQGVLRSLPTGNKCYVDWNRLRASAHNECWT
jgi:5-formyltetrahydrofolate cyclo-ligase